MSEESKTKQICFRVSPQEYGIIDSLCWEEIEGRKVRLTDLSKFAREFMLRGLKVYLEERHMIEKYKDLVEAEAK